MLAIVDIEATCGDSIPSVEQEAIEIGAVLCTDAGEVIEPYSALIKPSMHTQLTDFCVDLTGIQQSEVDEAPPFRDVWGEFRAWMLHGAERWASWGAFDKRVLQENCRTHKIPWYMPEHVNLAHVFQRKAGRRRGSRGAMRLLGLKPSGRHHRGLDDARNIAVIVQTMRAKGWFS